MKVKTIIKLGDLSMFLGCAILVISYLIFPSLLHPIALPLVIVAALLIFSAIPILIKYEGYKE